MGGPQAGGNRKHYPHRRMMTAEYGWNRPDFIASDDSIDDRTLLMEYIGMDSLVDPLSGGIDLDPGSTDSGALVISNYPLWYGVKWTQAGGGAGIYRLGDRLSYTEQSTPPQRYRFDILASDLDANVSTALHASHPDTDGVLQLEVAQNAVSPTYSTTGQTAIEGKLVVSRWVTNGRIDRGTMDMQFVHADGAVERFNDVRYDEGGLPNGRMVRVPYSDAANEGKPPATYVHLPPR